MRSEDESRRLLLSSLLVGAVAIADGNARAQTLLWSYGSQVGDLDRMGDFNLDGVEDVVIADGALPVPTVLSGMDGSVLQTFAEQGSAGAVVAGIGDFDSDGVPDLIFGAY